MDYPKGASPWCAQHRCALASCKVVRSDPRSEESRTAKICTDEQKLHTEAYLSG